MAFLHLAAGLSGAKAVNNALAALGRDETALGQGDVLAEGPLHDIDHGGAARIAWWERLYGEALPDESVRSILDSEIWDRARGWDGDIVVWHGPHPSERLFVLRACFRLRETPNRIHEVVLRAERLRSDRPDFYDAVAITKQERLVAAWETRAKIEDVGARGKRWEELCASAGETVRSLEGDELVLRPLTIYDDEILETCTDDWIDSIRVIGTVLSMQSTTDRFLRWRVGELMRQRRLESRGDKNRMGLPEEVRRSRPRPL